MHPPRKKYTVTNWRGSFALTDAQAGYTLEGSARPLIEHRATVKVRSMKEQLKDIFSRYRGERTELIPILQDVQEALGYMPAEAMKETAAFLRVPASVVYGVVSFYAQFYLTRQGRHKIKVCQGTACHVRGGKRIMRTVQASLGIKPGGTTEDYEFSLERVACLGSCALAPVMVVDDKVYGGMTTAKAQKLLRQLRGESVARSGSAAG